MTTRRITRNIIQTVAPDGTIDNPFIIRTPEELDNVRNGLNYFYKLGNDIDLTAYLSSGGVGYAKWGASGWLPIGTYISASDIPAFAGVLDGDGYKISGLYINRSTSDYQGLFGVINNATILNLGVETTAAGIKGRSTTGALAGWCQGTGTITRCYSFGAGDVRTDINFYCGGLLGLIEADVVVSKCFSTLNVYGLRYAGGLVGYAYGNIDNCYATGNVEGAYYIGGLVGSQGAPASLAQNCFATGDIYASSHSPGGISGQQDGNCEIRNCFAANANVISNSSNTSWIGAIAAYVSGANNTWTNNYRRNDMIIQHAGVNKSMANDANGKDGGIKTAAELTMQSTYSGNGWVFSSTEWHWDSRGFPKLNIGAEDYPFPF